MALARRFDMEKSRIITTIKDAYLDRASRWSDIQEYLPFLYFLARSEPEVRVLELGARYGNSTLAFLAGAAESGGHVWSVDIDNILKYPDGMMKWRSLSRWTFVQGDDLALETQARLPDEVDILFVDSDHEYDHVKAEIFDYMPRISRGGIALFHDTDLETWPGRKMPDIYKPVRRALDEYCEEMGLTWENIPGQYGLGVVQVGSKPESYAAA